MWYLTKWKYEQFRRNERANWDYFKSRPQVSRKVDTRGDFYSHITPEQKVWPPGMPKAVQRGSGDRRGSTRRYRGYSNRILRMKGHYRRPFRKGYDRTGGYYGRFNYGSACNPRMEKKFLDDGVSMTPAGSAMTINDDLLIVSQGTSENDRIGRRIMVHSLFIRGYIKLSPGDDDYADSSDCMRIMVVQDKQCNGVLFGATDILEADDILMYNKLENKGRFKVWHDSCEQLKVDSAIYDGANTKFGHFMRPFNVFLKFKKPICVEYSSNTGVTAERKSNNLAICMLSERGNHVTFAYNTRIRFTD